MTGSWLHRSVQSRRQALAAVFDNLRQTPVGSFLGATVIAIALALPAGLYGLVANAERLVGNWDRGNEISIYLHRSVEKAEAKRLAGVLAHRAGVVAVRYVSPTQGLKELAASGHFGDTLALLPRNPLPPVLVLKPGNALTPPELATLVAAVQAMPDVASAEADLQWVQRLQAGIRLVQRLGILLGVALAIAVMVVVGNTARLQILNRRGEIELMKLVGATDAFIRRPFVYAGALQGLFGGALGWAVLGIAELVLARPVAHLATLYGDHFALRGPGFAGLFQLGGTGLLLGSIGSRFAVGRHLGDIEPAQE